MKIRLFNKDSWTQSSRIWIGINFDGQKKIYTIKFKDLSIFKPLSYQLLWEILWFEAMKYLTEPFTYEANGSKYFSPKTTADPHFCQVSFCLIPLLSEKGVTIRIAPVFAVHNCHDLSFLRPLLMMWINVSHENWPTFKKRLDITFRPSGT